MCTSPPSAASPCCAAPGIAPLTSASGRNDTFRELIVAATYLDKKHPGLLDIFAKPYQALFDRQMQVAAKARSKSSRDPSEGEQG